MSATTAYGYDNVRNLISVDGPLSGTTDTTYFVYDAVRQLEGMISPDPDGGGALLRRATRFTYNDDGQMTLVRQGTVTSTAPWTGWNTLAEVATAYDFIGRPIRRSLITSSTTRSVEQISYDAANRLDCVATRLNPSVFGSLPSSACTLSTQGANGPDHIGRMSYNNANQPTKMTLGYGTANAIDEWTATYNSNGRNATLADAGGNLTTFVYDGFDRLSRIRFPNTSGGGSSTTDYEEYSYNAASAVTVARRRDATTLTVAYDNLNRIASVTPSANGAAISYTYDLFSRMLTSVISGHTLTFTYDQLSRNLTQQSPLGAVSYQYDAAGRRTRITWPDSFYVQYDYNVVDDMTAVRENGASSGPGLLATYAYDNLGRRVSVTRGNGVTTSYGYDNALRLEEIAHNLTGTGSDQTLNFTYNTADQIIGRTSSNASYDFTPPSPSTTGYADNGLNQYTSIGGASQNYDSRGNLTTGSFGYDIFNRLTSGPNSAALSYDPIGRLYQTQSASIAATRFLYDGASMIGEYNTGGTLQRRYVHGPTIDEPIVWYEGSSTSDRRWLAADQLGSVIATIDGSGNALSINTYDEYGIPGSTNVGRFQYTGQAWLPEVALYHYRARAYAPHIGRFMQPDPILFEGGMNIYAYVGNDPINWFDPWGLQEDEINVWGKRPNNRPLDATLTFPRAVPEQIPNFNNVRLSALDSDEILVTAERSLRDRQRRFSNTRRNISNQYERQLCGFEGCVPTILGLGFGGPASAGRGLLGACGCFEEGTLVATPDGLRRIEEIGVGDLVLAWDEATGETSAQRVTDLIRPEPKVLWRLEVRNADSQSAIFHVTDDHPWYVEDEGWVETQHLRAGQRIETADDRGLIILDIAPTDRVERTYNLTVEGLHTFLVGEDGAVVHNFCTKLGIQITGFTRHGINRALGDGASRAGVSTRAWRDALANPRSVTSGVDSAGRPFQVYTGQNARVVINPQTGQIVSMNPLGRAGVRGP